MPQPPALRLTVLLVLFGCGTTDDPTGPDGPGGPALPDPPVATSLGVSPTSVSFTAVGQTAQLTATVRDQNGAVMNGATVDWSSSSTGVAAVSATGLVTAVADGAATITAASGSATGSADAAVTLAADRALEPAELCSEHPPSAVATFADAALEGAIRAALGVTASDDLTCGALAAMTTLTANSLAIADLTGIQNLVGLQVLRLNFNDHISDVSPLADLTELFDLGLNRNAISDIAPLAGLTGLTTLDVANNAVSELDALSGLTGLRSLNLGNNEISDAGVVAGLNGLVVLTLNLNPITDLAPVGRLTGLVSLDVSFTEASDLAPLSALTVLRHLRIGSSAVTDIGPVANMVELTRLLASYNRIVDLSPVESLTQLEVIDLGHNPDLTDVQPLLDNPGVGAEDDVYLGGTRVTCDDYADLEAVGVAVHGDCFVPLDPIALDVVTVGDRHACGLSPDGAAYCWGDNFVGQLGDGTESWRTLATPVSGGMTFTDIAAGRHHTCALATGGMPYCWGANGSGQLGDGTTSFQSSTPVPVDGGHVFASIEAGDWHTCAVTADGDGYCWGANTTFQLGSRFNGDCPVFGGEACIERSPLPISGALEFATVSAGRLHSCGVTVGADAYCWGISLEGQLGDNATSLSGRLEILVHGDLSWSEVVAAGNDSGGGHTCAVTTTGDAYCWGGSAELGNGSRLAYTPRLVSGGHTFEHITARGGTVATAHTCATTTSGDAYCWGANAAGQLGDGSNTARSAPVAVTGGLVLTGIGAGGFGSDQGFTCATANDGYVYCWGMNSHGQLGDGTYEPRASPARVGVG